MEHGEDVLFFPHSYHPRRTQQKASISSYHRGLLYACCGQMWAVVCGPILLLPLFNWATFLERVLRSYMWPERPTVSSSCSLSISISLRIFSSHKPLRHSFSFASYGPPTYKDPSTKCEFQGPWKLLALLSCRILQFPARRLSLPQ